MRRLYIDPKSKSKVCKVVNCDGVGFPNSRGKRYPKLGYCQKHYTRLKKHGDINYISTRKKNDKSKSNHKLYKTYSQMKNRCYYVNNCNYSRYGGNGITVCDRWLGEDGFWNFAEDMGERPEGNTLDRIDNTKEYSPDNCRWATWHEQNANRTDNNKVVGVSYLKSSNAYVATLMVSGKKVLNKYFKNYNDAVEARKKAEAVYIKQ